MVSDSEAKVIIARNIKRILDEQGRTMYWLAKQTGDADTKIGRILRAVNVPSAGFLIRTSRALGVSLDELTGEEVTANQDAA